MSDWIFTSYLFRHFDQIWARLVEHLTISGLSLGIAIVISLPLGLLLSRAKSLATPVLVLLGIIYTIPSFALLAFLVPIMGIGIKPAVIALSAYALVALTRNTMVAFDGVDPSVKEAAKGMGMSAGQMLWRVEVPLALPVIVAGLRIATLSTVSLASIAAWIAAGGLGQLLRDGGAFFDVNPSELYAGVITISVIAITADLIFRLVERSVRIPGAAERKPIFRWLAGSVPKEA